MQNKALALLFAWALLPVVCPAQAEADTVKVHFLYGSRPARKFRGEEGKWFGGKLGGHVGVEVTPGVIIDFVPSGDFHVFGKKDPLHGRFVSRSISSFWTMFGAVPDSAKGLIVSIPVNDDMRTKLDSVVASYLDHSPYDYAFFGMRCAAAAYDLLGNAGICRDLSTHGACWRYFYPRKLRRKLLREADRNNWRVERRRGTERRVWDNH